MAKLLALIASLTLVLLVVDASIYRTTVIVDEDFDNQRGGGRGSQDDCRQEFQRAQNLRNCQRYIQRQSQGREDIDLYGEDNQRQQQQELQECCRQLRQVNDQCRCEALRIAAQQSQQQQQRRGSQELREAFRVAQNLPSRCNVSPGECDFRRQPY